MSVTSSGKSDALVVSNTAFLASHLHSSGHSSDMTRTGRLCKVLLLFSSYLLSLLDFRFVNWHIIWRNDHQIVRIICSWSAKLSVVTERRKQLLTRLRYSQRGLEGKYHKREECSRWKVNVLFEYFQLVSSSLVPRYWHHTMTTSV